MKFTADQHLQVSDRLVTSRRSFVAGFGTLIAAPAIVPCESLMPVRNIFVTVDGEVMPVWKVDADLLIGRDHVGRVLENTGRKPGDRVVEARRILRRYPFLLRRPPDWIREDFRKKWLQAFLSATFSEPST